MRRSCLDIRQGELKGSISRRKPSTSPRGQSVRRKLAVYAAAIATLSACGASDVDNFCSDLHVQQRGASCMTACCVSTPLSEPDQQQACSSSE